MKYILILLSLVLSFTASAYEVRESLVEKGVTRVPPEHPFMKVQGMVGILNKISCTVFMIGPHHAMTASHCFGEEWGLIHENDLNNAEVFFPGYGKFKVKSYMKNDIKYTGAKSARYFSKDYAVLALVPANDAKFPPSFEMRQTWGKAETVYMPEHRWDYKNEVNTNNFFFNASECLTKDIKIKKQTFDFLGKYSFLISECKIKEGMSGGPLLFEEDGKFYVNGINTSSNGDGDEGTETYSVQFTNEIIQEVRTWISNH